eukprot:g3012.t1
MGKGTTDEGDDANSSHIRTFLRIRPSKRPSGYIKVDEYDKTRLGFHVPVETKDGEYVNNTRTSHNFKFDGVLGEKATQEDVFAKIGKGAVSNVLNGYNSTVFAYGQTGSGKTFTVTGGAERYVDRGIIPRALSLIFAEFKERSDQQFTCHISYLEIYNEQGFDLLDPSHESKKLEDLPKVALMEDEDGNIHLRNLSVYLAANEEEALNYLFLGDTNRAISETAMNKASSRSHCIFTISVEGRKHGSEKVTRSKLHLAQTEESISTCRFAQRVSTIKNDARVNEDVDPGVLIRRLRSDCANLSDELAFLKGESGEGDELTSEEAEELKSRPLSIGAYTLTKLKRCFSVFKAMVLDAGQGMDNGSGDSGGGGEGNRLAHSQGHGSFGEGGHRGVGGKPGEGDPSQLGGQLLSLRDALRQRDNEIAILVNMLKQGKCHACAATAPAAATAATTTAAGQATAGRRIPQNLRHDPGGTATTQNHGAPLAGTASTTSSAAGGKSAASDASAAGRVMAPRGTVGGRDLRGRDKGSRAPPIVEYPSDAGVRRDPQRAFEYFRERHPGRTALEENKKLLGDKYARAKAMGERVNQARSTIQYLKNTIEQVRRERALDGLMEDGSRVGGDDNTGDEADRRRMELDEEEDEEEARCKAAIEVEKRVYKGSFQELRELKSEIEHIQRLLEKGRSSMQAEFQAWHEPPVCSAEDDEGGVAAPGTSRLEGGGAKPKPFQADHRTNHPGAAHHNPPNSVVGTLDNQHVVATMPTTTTTTTRERDRDGSDTREVDGGGTTPTRRPRPPVDAWGTPPASVSHHRGSSSSSSAMTGGVSSGGGGGSGSVATGAGRGALHGGAGGGGLLPPLTGNREADDDIAAFYRAKEELERRKSVAGRNGDTSH